MKPVIRPLKTFSTQELLKSLLSQTTTARTIFNKQVEKGIKDSCTDSQGKPQLERYFELIFKKPHEIARLSTELTDLFDQNNKAFSNTLRALRTKAQAAMENNNFSTPVPKLQPAHNSNTTPANGNAGAGWFTPNANANGNGHGFFLQFDNPTMAMAGFFSPNRNVGFESPNRNGGFNHQLMLPNLSASGYGNGHGGFLQFDNPTMAGFFSPNRNVGFESPNRNGGFNHQLMLPNLSASGYVHEPRVQTPNPLSNAARGVTNPTPIAQALVVDPSGGWGRQVYRNTPNHSTNTSFSVPPPAVARRSLLEIGVGIRGHVLEGIPFGDEAWKLFNDESYRTEQLHGAKGNSQQLAVRVSKEMDKVIAAKELVVERVDELMQERDAIKAEDHQMRIEHDLERKCEKYYVAKYLAVREANRQLKEKEGAELKTTAEAKYSYANHVAGQVVQGAKLARQIKCDANESSLAKTQC
jgi:hypothetical protein